MNGGITGVGPNQNGLSQNVNTPEQTQGVTVQSNGQNVTTQPSISSLVADAQEEMGVLLQDKSSDKLSKRDARSRASNRVKEALEKYLRSVTSVNQTERFEQLVSRLKNLQNASPEQIRGMIEEFKEQSGDDHLESAVLLALEELFASEGTNEELLEAIRGVKEDFGNELRNFYENQVKTYEGVSDVYEYLLGDYGEEDFLKATDSLMTRLGNDLQSQGTNVDTTKVKATVDSLYHLEVARNTFSAFAGLMEKMRTVFGQSL